MNTLSLGDIAKLTGYSRARIHQLAARDRLTIPGDAVGIPFSPIRKPPEGQYRYEDTPELRTWCKAKRTSKPRAQPRDSSPRSASARVAKAIKGMRAALKSGKVELSDVKNAIALLDICSRLEVSALLGEQPCTKGALAIAAHFNLLDAKWTRIQNLWITSKAIDAVFRLLKKYEKQIQGSQEPAISKS